MRIKSPPYVINNSRVANLVSKMVMPISAITLWPFILVEGGGIKKDTLNHEQIHIKQWTECLLVGFVLIYLWDYLYSRCVRRMNHVCAYCNIRFEQEAYNNQHNLDYLKVRKLFGWWRFHKLGAK